MKLLASLLTAAIFAAPAFSAFSAGETPVKADAAKGQASYGAVCAACHAADGNSTIPLQPKLAGQHPEYLVKQLREFKDGKRNDPVMKGFASTLSDGDMALFIRLLANDDPDLFNWLMNHGEPADAQLQRMVKLIQTRNRERGPVAI